MDDKIKAMGSVLTKSFFLAHNFLEISMTSTNFSSFFSSMVVYFMRLAIAMIFIIFMCTLYNENTLRCKILCKSTNNFRKAYLREAFLKWEDFSG